MPITGFLEGYNEQRKVEQTLEDQRQLAGLRAMEIAANVNKLQTDLAVKSKLAEVFTGPSSQDPNAGPEDVLADKLTRAGTAIMAVDPVKGLSFTNAAAAIQQKKALAKQEQMNTEIKARDEQGGYLTAMRDQDSYDTLLPKALQAGWKLPTWFTGDWAKDGPRIQAEAAGTMKASEQATVQKNLVNEQIRLTDMARKAEVAKAAADYQMLKGEIFQSRLDETRRENDRRAAAQQQRFNKMAIPDQKDFDYAKTALEARTDLPEELSPKAKSEIVKRAATEARRAALQNDTDYDEEINNALGRILREDTVDTKIETQFLGFTIPGMTKKGKALKPRGETAMSIERKDTSADTSGTAPSKAEVEAQGFTYEPAKYNYRTINGKVYRKAK